MTSLQERITCIGADWPVQVAGQFQRQMAGKPNGWSLLLGSEDLAQAYRRLPCADPGYTVFAIWDPHTARVRWFTTRGFCFGLKSSVVQFNRLPVFMARAATRLIPVVTSSYFDYFPIVEATWAQGGQILLRKFAILIGFPQHQEIARSGDRRQVSRRLDRLRSLQALRYRHLFGHAETRRRPRS
jgi:hypothetical protein